MGCFLAEMVTLRLFSKQPNDPRDAPSRRIPALKSKPRFGWQGRCYFEDSNHENVVKLWLIMVNLWLIYG